MGEGALHRFGIIVGAIAVVLAITSGAFAAKHYLITSSAQIKPGSISYASLSASAKSKLAGQDGATGPQGPAGTTGPAGPAGPAGARGAEGPAGQQGPVGPQGPKGEQGTPGEDGAPSIGTWGGFTILGRDDTGRRTATGP